MEIIDNLDAVVRAMIENKPAKVKLTVIKAGQTTTVIKNII